MGWRNMKRSVSTFKANYIKKIISCWNTEYVLGVINTLRK